MTLLRVVVTPDVRVDHVTPLSALVRIAPEAPTAAKTPTEPAQAIDFKAGRVVVETVQLTPSFTLLSILLDAFLTVTHTPEPVLATPVMIPPSNPVE
jgi:hypothetical protein